MLSHLRRSPLFAPYGADSGGLACAAMPGRELSPEIQTLIARLSEQVVVTALGENPLLPFARFEEAIATSVEYLTGSLFMRRYPDTISIFGASKASSDSLVYQKTRKFAETIVQDSDYYIMTGGGPGLMEAGSIGAGKARCIGAALKLPHETGPNPHIELHRLLKFHSFPPRIATLAKALGLLMAEGGVGTLEEGFKIIDLIAKGNIPPKAVLWLGTEFWQKVIDPMVSYMVSEGFVQQGIIQNLFYQRSEDPADLAFRMLDILKREDSGRTKWQDQNYDFDVNHGDITTPFPIINNRQVMLNAEGRATLVKVQEHIDQEIKRISIGQEENLDKAAIVAFFKDLLDAVYLDASLDSHLNSDKVILLLGNTSSRHYQQQLEKCLASGITVLAKSNFRGNKNGIKLWKHKGGCTFGHDFPIRFKYTGLQAFVRHSDQIVVCPGGTGTCAALFQMLTWKQTKQFFGRSGTLSLDPINFIDEKWYESCFIRPLTEMKRKGYADKSPGDNDFRYGRHIRSVDDLC